MVAEGVKQKRWLQGDKDRKSGCSRRETKTEKVVAAEIIGEANPEREKEEKRKNKDNGGGVACRGEWRERRFSLGRASIAKRETH